MKIVTIRQALQHVANHPDINTDDMLSVHVHELMARTLFQVANGATASEKSSLTKANIARNIIFNRLVGRRRAGTPPTTETAETLEFLDLTGGGAING